MDANTLGKQLYEQQENKCIPPWDNLEPKGATQSLWIERAQKLLSNSPILISQPD